MFRSYVASFKEIHIFFEFRFRSMKSLRDQHYFIHDFNEIGHIRIIELPISYKLVLKWPRTHEKKKTAKLSNKIQLGISDAGRSQERFFGCCAKEREWVRREKRNPTEPQTMYVLIVQSIKTWSPIRCLNAAGNLVGCPVAPPSSIQNNFQCNVPKTTNILPLA